VIILTTTDMEFLHFIVKTKDFGEIGNFFRVMVNFMSRRVCCIHFGNFGGMLDLGLIFVSMISVYGMDLDLLNCFT
jgi:hypothetical protein